MIQIRLSRGHAGLPRLGTLAGRRALHSTGLAARDALLQLLPLSHQPLWGT